MASVDKAADGTWTVRYYIQGPDGSKQTTKRGFSTKREALEYAETARKLNKGKIAGVTFGDFAEYYLQDKIKSKKIKARTETMKRYLIDTHLLPYFKNKKVTDINALDLERWQAEIMAKGYERTYERMIANQMNAILNHAVRLYGLSTNPYSSIDKMGNSDAKDEAQYWELDEYEKFIATFEKGNRFYVLFELLFWTGMRIGEALSLTFDRINPDTKIVSIFETYHREKKRDLLTEPKTESSVRKIEIPSFLLTELTDYYHSLYEYPADARLFPVVERTVEKQMASHIKKAEVSYITVHDLRHSHITYLLDQGVPLKDIANRVGHKNINQIIRTYSHARKKSEQQIANLLDNNEPIRNEVITMTTLALFFNNDGTSNGATLECYTPSGDRYLRKYLKPCTALTPNSPDIYNEYPINNITFVDYLTTNNLLPSLDADGIIEAYNYWDKYAEESLSQYRLPVNDFFSYLDIMTKVTKHKLKVSRAVLSPIEIMESDQ